MTGKKRWKTVLEYTAGILILGFSLALAWFLPGWYGKWQDKRMMEQVELSTRENIEFLDIDSLDIAGRLKMIQEAEVFNWAIGGYEGLNNDMGGTDFAALVKKCEEGISQWCEKGLLPEVCSGWAQEKYLMLQSSVMIYMEQSTLPVCVFGFISEDENILIVVMDMEKEVIYYAAAAGSVMMEEMARMLGYDSYDSMYMRVQKDDQIVQQPDTSGYDFASVCGAESAEISGNSGELELRVKLTFDTFEGMVYRDMIRGGLGYGMAVIYGTEHWHELVMGVIGEYGIWMYPVETQAWIKDIQTENWGESEDSEVSSKKIP